MDPVRFKAVNFLKKLLALAARPSASMTPRLFPCLLLALLALLVGCSPSAEPPVVVSGPVDANAATLLLAPEDLLTLQSSARSIGPVVSGTIQPARRADLRAEVGSVVTQVLKDNGERVRQGDLLLRLDDTSLRDTLGSAEAAARAAAQTLDQAERQMQRLRTLQQQGMTTTQAAEDAELRRNNAQSDLVTARAQVVSARQQLQHTSVRAPFDGVVTERRVSVGDTVQIGRELLKVIDPSSMRFEGLVSADRMSELKTGQSVSFRVNGFPQVLFAGTVTRIDPTANVDTRQVALLVDFADPAAAPKVAGLFAEGRIETGSGEALLLGEGALTRTGSEAFVWRVDGDRLTRIAVRLGERDPRSGDFPVTDGLKAGDRILRRPGDALVDGQKVELVAPGALASSAAELK